MSTALPIRPVLHSEWIKIRSLRGSLAALIAVPAATVGIQALAAAAIGQSERGALGEDPLFASYYGILWGQIAAMAFGTTTLSAEFHNGALRTSLAAVPGRTRFYLSKMTVIGGLALAVGLVTGFLTFVAGQAFMGPYALHLGDPGSYRAIVGSGLYLALIALLAAGLTALLRSGALVLSLLIPLLLMVSFIVGAATGGVAEFLPDRAGQLVMHGAPGGHLGPWSGLGVLALWAGAALAGGWLAVRRRAA
ncbi:ABC transporter permease [Streptomyces sp. NPDC089915]|uniref:ABC transporter permease n=1 Tax=Streptomyces sp. NPDC089915 TaxID=3155186 RepID=UPI00343E871D